MARSAARKTSARTSTRARARAFTLIEMMIVVAIVGVIAVLAVVAYRRYILAARTSEAAYMVGSIRSAEEAIRAESTHYLNVSTTLTNYYPFTSVPQKQKMGWPDYVGAAPAGVSAALHANWRSLGARSDGPVAYTYAVVAGAAGATPPSTNASNGPTWPTTTDEWYVIQAASDLDGDGTNSYVIGSSFTNELYIENEGG